MLVAEFESRCGAAEVNQLDGVFAAFLRGLHAGVFEFLASSILELHGNGERPECLSCGCTLDTFRTMEYKNEGCQLECALNPTGFTLRIYPRIAVRQIESFYGPDLCPGTEQILMLH